MARVDCLLVPGSTLYRARPTSNHLLNALGLCLSEHITCSPCLKDIPEQKLCQQFARNDQNQTNSNNNCYCLCAHSVGFTLHFRTEHYLLAYISRILLNWTDQCTARCLPTLAAVNGMY